MIFLWGCKKFVQVDPPVTGIISATVYSNNTSAEAVLTSIYDNMISGLGLSSGFLSMSQLSGLSADELKDYSGVDPNSSYYTNTLKANTYVNFWAEIYQEIHVANSAIEGLSASKSVSEPVKLQLMGEAKFMRAFLHFYAVNLYGDIPLVTTTDYRINNVIARTPQAQVYQQIIADLKDAQNELSDSYLTPAGVGTDERVRPSKGAATALLARAYLYTEKWDSAEAMATAVINNTNNYSLVTNLNNVFLKNSSEAIWQLQSIFPGINTFDAYYFILASPPATSFAHVALSSNLLNVFETGDKRFSNWIGSYTSDSLTFYYYPNKYKIGNYDPSQPVNEYTMVLRLAEQYLIRAEARAQQGNIPGAQTDINTIRTRAGLPNTLASDQASLLTAILHERQTELFTEWGHRWLDLKRTSKIDAVMSVVTQQKGGTWDHNWSLYPIPQSDILINTNLTQNPGY